MPLRKDPSRYFLAFAAAQICRCNSRGISERKTVRTLVSVLSGDFLETSENLANWTNGKPFLVVKTDRKVRGSIGPHGRSRDAFGPVAEDVSRKLRRLIRCPEESDDGKWLRAMSFCWLIALEGSGAEIETQALHFANIAGEADYFTKVILRVIRGPLNWMPELFSV
jgi:hypothetical protein